MKNYAKGPAHGRWREAEEIVCINCFEKFVAKRPYERKKKFCNYKCCIEYRRKGNSWNPRVRAEGHKTTGSDGYVLVRVGGAWEREQRVVAAQMLGRKILRSEVVHHINGDKGDNRPENLEVLTRREHMVRHVQAEAIGLEIMAYESSVVDRMVSGC